MTQRMLDIARNSHVPVVGVTETQPIGLSYQDWMLKQLDDLEQALAQSST
jgi:zinc/manganese transport system substrate-binding protein